MKFKPNDVITLNDKLYLSDWHGVPLQVINVNSKYYTVTILDDTRLISSDNPYRTGNQINIVKQEIEVVWPGYEWTYVRRTDTYKQYYPDWF